MQSVVQVMALCAALTLQPISGQGADTECPIASPCVCKDYDGALHHANEPRQLKRIMCLKTWDGNFPKVRAQFAGQSAMSVVILYAGLQWLPYKAFENLLVTSLDITGNDLEDRVDGRGLDGPVRQSLLSLKIEWSNVTELQESVFRGLENLKNLSLAENRLCSVPVRLFHDLRELQHLSLSGNPLEQLPDDLLRLQTNLRSLDLGYCRLTRIQPGLLSNLWNLKHLDLRGNQLVSVVGRLFADLWSLETLLLGHNPLTSLEAGCFWGLRNLRTLNVQESALERVSPGVFTDTKQLDTLDLGDNNLTHISHGALYIESLQQLSLDGNSLTEVPRDVIYMQHLLHLDLSYNNLTTLNKCLFSHVTSLRMLNVRENPFHCGCALFWLRHLQRGLLRAFSHTRVLPFVPGRCATPDKWRGVGVTSWLDLDCLRDEPRAHPCQ